MAQIVVIWSLFVPHLIVIFFVFLCVGCPSKQAPTPPTTKTSTVIHIGEVDVHPLTLPALDAKLVPDASQIQAQAIQQLKTHNKQFTHQPKRKTRHLLRVQFTGQSRPVHDQTRVVAMSWRCMLNEQPAMGQSTLPAAEGKLVRHVVPVSKQKTIQPFPRVGMVESLQQDVLDATDRCIESLAQQWQIRQSTPASLGEMKVEGFSVEAASQWLERVRGEKLKQHLKGVRQLLKHPAPRVVLLAMSIVVQFKDLSADAAMVEAASTLSQNQQTPAYSAALYQIGALNGPEGRRYLQTIIDSHTNKELGKVAQEALRP